MRLRVRTPDGELSFGSKFELSKAYAQGLVDPTDEILEEGGTRWRKASELPELKNVRAKPPGVPAQLRSMLFLVATLVVALVLIFRESETYTSRGVGLLLAFLAAYFLIGNTRKSLRRTAR